MSHVFRIGDVVTLKAQEHSITSSGPKIGAIGVVVYINPAQTYRPGVRWDKEFPGGHVGGAYGPWCTHGHGWYVDGHKLRYLGRRVNPRMVDQR